VFVSSLPEGIDLDGYPCGHLCRECQDKLKWRQSFQMAKYRARKALCGACRNVRLQIRWRLRAMWMAVVRWQQGDPK
jgi:hypothetical protein